MTHDKSVFNFSSNITVLTAFSTVISGVVFLQTALFIVVMPAAFPFCLQLWLFPPHW